MARGGDLALCAGRPGAQRKSDNSTRSSDEYRFRTLAGDEAAPEAAVTAYRQDVAGPALVRINHNSETTPMQEQK
jgi:hypothetical protein